MKYKGKLTLVGAGPGDPELISLKGIKALQQAGAVLYDALVHPDLLQYAPAEAPRIFVGKRAGHHHRSQQQINQLILSYALSYGHVVRLKGGDPFVFGRGQEEVEYARIFELEVEVVPGISSATALPGLQGVPLTCRGINESFWVLTATTRGGKLSRDLQQAAHSAATVVILMGMRRLRQICDCFRQAGKGQTPAMAIQHGSLPHEKVALGTVDSLPQEVAAKQIGTPGIIIIGEVVGLHTASLLKWAHRQPEPTSPSFNPFIPTS
ncbi:MAG: uroporphyrinogen-III C-methyltransferase [Bacteroidetes bacterium]|nr:MAG: uroporphyrinogen-III C-methyltransferase [Bacteroidota bacterium]